MQIGDLVKWGQTAKSYWDKDTNKVGIVVDTEVDRINPSTSSTRVCWPCGKVEWVDCQWLLDAYTGVRYV